MISLIITAAGLSRRHPPNKLLNDLNGKSVIQQTVESFIDFNMDIRVVVGYQKGEILQILNNRFGSRITVIDNPEYRSGLSSSIKAGLANPQQNLEYWAFSNGDKPFIQPATIQQILDKLHSTEQPILVPTYEGTNGHPTFFSSRFTDKLYMLSGDEGARSIIQRHGRLVKFIPVHDEGIILDMDKYLNKNS